MNAAQQQWFEEGAGCGGGPCFQTSTAMLQAIQLIGVTAFILYTAWVCLQAYEDFGAERINGTSMLVIWCRSVFILMVLLYLVIN